MKAHAKNPWSYEITGRLNEKKECVGDEGDENENEERGKKYCEGGKTVCTGLSFGLGCCVI